MSNSYHNIPNPFVWNESFVVGDKAADAQHRKLFALVAAFEANPNKTTYTDVLSELQLHFQEEENSLPVALENEDLASHQEDHKKSLEMFAERKPDKKTASALKRWLVHHIKTEDMKLKDLFGQSGQTAAPHPSKTLGEYDEPPVEINIKVDEEETEPWYKDPNEIKLLVMIVCCLAFMSGEMAVGFLVNSLALISDAFHMIADCISYIVALIAIRWSKNAKGKSYTFGWERSEIIGAFINGMLLLSISLFITLEAIQRFVELPHVTQPLLVVYVGSGGVVLNLIGMGLFGELEYCFPTEEPEEVDLTQSPSPQQVSNDNLKAVFIHILGDLVGQLCAIASGLIIHFLDSPYRYYSDPALSLAIVFLLSKHSIPIVKKAMQIFMQRTPRYIQMDKLKARLLEVPDIISLHELHVWSLSGETTVASCHVTLLVSANYGKLLQNLKSIFHSVGVHSITIQPEFVSLSTLQSQHPECQLSCNKTKCNLKPCCPPVLQEPIDLKTLQDRDIVVDIKDTKKADKPNESHGQSADTEHSEHSVSDNDDTDSNTEKEKENGKGKEKENEKDEMESKKGKRTKMGEAIRSASKKITATTTKAKETEKI